LICTNGEKVIQWAKKTGDYSVLSHADLCVIALTYAMGEEDKRNKAIQNDTASVLFVL